jgi:adenosylcobinamide-GDP ribazoletransferase
MVYAIFTLPYARPSGLGKVFKQETRWPMFALAMLVTLIVMVGLVWVTGFLLVFLIWFLIWVMTVAVAAYFKSKFVGLTGDTYGAINEVTETGVLVLASWLFGVG